MSQRSNNNSDESDKYKDPAYFSLIYGSNGEYKDQYKDDAYFKQHVQDFCTLNEDGDTFLNEAVLSGMQSSVEIVARSGHFDTIKNIVNKDGNYAVLYAAVRGNSWILSYLLADSRNCKILLPARGDGCPNSLLHEVIGTVENARLIVHILLRDLSNRKKYSKYEIDYIIGFKGRVKRFGEIDAFNFAIRLGKNEIAEMIWEFALSESRRQ